MTAPLTKEEAYARLGAITREMHEALTVLGGNQLHQIVEEIPNARDRLAHVGKMTEDAANKVLTLVENAKPQCDDLATRGEELGKSLSRMAASEDLTVERARGLMARYATVHKLTHIDQLKAFDSEGYAFDAKASTPLKLVFRRKA